MSTSQINKLGNTPRDTTYFEIHSMYPRHKIYFNETMSANLFQAPRDPLLMTENNEQRWQIPKTYIMIYQYRKILVSERYKGQMSKNNLQGVRQNLIQKSNK